MRQIQFLYKSIAFLCFLLFVTSCEKGFLDVPPRGSLDEKLLETRAGINNLLVGAYSALTGQGMGGTNWNTGPSNWIYGSVVGGDAHKGSTPGDQNYVHQLANFSANPTTVALNEKWFVSYEGVSRCNNVLRILPKVKGLSSAEVTNIKAQALFLRGHFYFELKKMFNMVPWIDENSEEPNVPNDKDIWPNIEADFKFAMENLPEVQDDAGKANKWAAASYLAKCYMFEHKFQEAKDLYDVIMTKGKTALGISYGLFPRFDQNFLPQDELSSPEAVFPIEATVNAGNGTPLQSRGGIRLNYPISGPTNCCGFFQPSQDLVNAYRTNANGLPYLEEHNAYPIKSDMNLLSTESFTPDNGNIDPRLDWTVGRRGIPYLDWGVYTGFDWVRDQTYGGPYSPIKHVFWQKDFDKYSNHTAWGVGTAVNYLEIRYSDVVLMAAEANAQVGNLNKAEELVNVVRNRAANPAGFVYEYKNPDKPLDGFSNIPAANYYISPYPTGTFESKGKDYALQAIYYERRLELAMEGHRFFDLVRWGIAENTLNDYFAYEGSILPNTVGNGHFTAPEDNYYPIPQEQIDLSVVAGKPTLIQNPGY